MSRSESQIPEWGICIEYQSKSQTDRRIQKTPTQNTKIYHLERALYRSDTLQYRLNTTDYWMMVA
jgi:hypothetical protein